MTDKNSWQPPGDPQLPPVTPPAPSATTTPVQAPAQPGPLLPPVPPHFAPPGALQYGAPQPGAPQYSAPQYSAPQQAPQFVQPRFAPPQYGAPQYAAPQYGAPQYGAPQYGVPQYAANFGPGQQAYGAPRPSAQAGWAPPPKPGLIPLRPLTFGNLLGASFQVMRRNPRPTFGVALLLNLLTYGLFTAIVSFVAVDALDRFSSASFDEQDEILNGSVGLGLITALVPGILFVVISGIVQGIVSLEVSRGTIGEKLQFGQLWTLAKGRIGALIGWSLLLTAVLYGALVVVAIIATLIAVIGANPESVVIAILFALVIGFGLVVLSAWLSTKVSLVPTILMLERRTLFASVARSWSLTRGYFWKTFGTQLLVSAIISAASQVVVTPITFLAGIGGGLLIPTGDEESTNVLLIVVTVISAAIGVLFQAITIVAVSAVTSLIYIDIRMRKEGLDLELTRFVEARQSGDSSVTNPYAAADVTDARYASGPGVPAAVPDGSPWV